MPITEPSQIYQVYAANPLTPTLDDIVPFQPDDAGATEMGAAKWSDIQTAFTGKQDTLGYTAEDEANKSNDGTMASASTTEYPTVFAAKTYTDSMVVGLLQDVGNYDASSNLFPSTGGSGGGGAILEGDLWFISVAGTLGGSSVLVGYSIRALIDSPGQTTGNWGILSSGLGYIPEDVSNKSTNISADSGSDIKYPSVKAVEDFVNSTSSAYKVYSILLTRNGGGLSVTQMQDTIGNGSGDGVDDIEWLDPGVAGVLRAQMTSGNPFTTGKLWIMPMTMLSASGDAYFVTGNRVSTFQTLIQFNFRKYDNTVDLPYFTNLPVEIRVYN